MLFFIVPVGIRKPQFPERGGFPVFHFPGFFIRKVIEAQKMQGAVHHHVSPVLLRSFVLLLSLPFHDAFTDHQVAEVVFGKIRERLGRAFTWIDHHATAINASEENGYTDIPGARVNGVAACELTWRYYHSDVFVPVPMSVRLLSLYDTWTKDAEYSWENQILPYQWSLREEFGRDARKFVEEFVLSERYRYEVSVQEDILRGNIILSYARRSGCEGVAAYGFSVTIGPEKHPGVCCLTNTFGGLAFEEALREIPGAVAVCVNRLSPKEGQPEETYKVSIYAGDSKPGWHIGNYLRANYTGGGHEGAGGGYLTRAQFITLITEGRL